MNFSMIRKKWKVNSLGAQRAYVFFSSRFRCVTCNNSPGDSFEKCSLRYATKAAAPDFWLKKKTTEEINSYELYSSEMSSIRTGELNCKIYSGGKFACLFVSFLLHLESGILFWLLSSYPWPCALVGYFLLLYTSFSLTYTCIFYSFFFYFSF